MEVRRVLLTLFLLAAGIPADAAAVKRYPLDSRGMHSVTVGTEAPTTVIFPGGVTALEGANVSAHAEDEPDLLLSHEPGSQFFSVRALQPKASGAINVIFRDEVYVLTFRTGQEPDRAVTFYKQPEGPAAGDAVQRSGPVQLLSLLDQAKNYAQLAQHYPALVQDVERTSPGMAMQIGSLTVTVEEVLRFDREDALALRLRLNNESEAVVRYAPARMAVRVGPTLYPVAVTDASGEVPPGGEMEVWLVIVGGSDGTRVNLSPKNVFTPVLAEVQ